MTNPHLEEFITAYWEAAFWSSTGMEDEFLDARFSVIDLNPQFRASQEAECAKFVADNGVAILNGGINVSEEHSIFSMAGHDFWLTRQGHGAGFWDGDWMEPYASTLTEACKNYVEVDLYTEGLCK